MPAWQKGQSGNPAGRPPTTPVVTPRIRRYLDLPMHELRDLLDRVKVGDVPDDMKAADALALMMIKKALTDTAWGDGTRDTIIERLDGKAASVEVDVQVGVAVNLKWSDSE